VRIGGPVRGRTAHVAGASIAAVGRRIAIAALVVAGVVAGAFYLGDDGGRFASSPVQSSRPVAAAGETLTATFSICGTGRRTDCVVDGDTFWFRGEKVRLLDIDAPEVSPPRCRREAELSDAATRRLQTLLNAGPFTLTAGARDQDQYGRKLRTVSRGGLSIGEVLVAEGLARRWNGPRRSWCDG
jgi:endonuclease YncB( thermonuclease family)